MSLTVRNGSIVNFSPLCLIQKSLVTRVSAGLTKLSSRGVRAMVGRFGGVLCVLWECYRGVRRCCGAVTGCNRSAGAVQVPLEGAKKVAYFHIAVIPTVIISNHPLAFYFKMDCFPPEHLLAISSHSLSTLFRISLQQDVASPFNII